MIARPNPARWAGLLNSGPFRARAPKAHPPTAQARYLGLTTFNPRAPKAHDPTAQAIGLGTGSGIHPAACRVAIESLPKKPNPTPNPARWAGLLNSGPFRARAPTAHDPTAQAIGLGTGSAIHPAACRVAIHPFDKIKRCHLQSQIPQKHAICISVILQIVFLG